MLAEEIVIESNADFDRNINSNKGFSFCETAAINRERKTVLTPTNIIDYSNMTLDIRNSNNNYQTATCSP